MHVLVTGGAGFIGSYVVDALISGGHAVTVMDDLDPAAHAERPDYLNVGAKYAWSDVRDPDAWRSALAGVDAICHQAGKVGLGVDFADVDAYVSRNDLGTAVALRAMHDARFAGRIVLASSMVVYGEGRYRCEVDGVVTPGPRRAVDLDAGRFEPPCPSCGADLRSEPIPEDAPLDPRNVYAATKLHQEHLCRAYVREHPGATVTALRYHNVFGPRMPRNTPYAGVASIFRSALAGGRAPEVTEDGRQMRNFVHVRDVAHANVLALTNSEPFDGVCNVASPVARTVGEMAAAMARAFGHEQGSSLWPRITGSYRLGDVRHVYAATDVARARLGFVAETPFDSGVEEFVHAPLRAPIERPETYRPSG